MGESPPTPAFVVAGDFLSTTTARSVVKKRSADERKGTDNFEPTKQTGEDDKMLRAIKRVLTPSSSAKKAKKQTGRKDAPIDLVTPTKLTFDEAAQKDEEKVEEMTEAAKAVKAGKPTKVVCIRHFNGMKVTMVQVSSNLRVKIHIFSSSTKTPGGSSKRSRGPTSAAIGRLKDSSS